MRRRHYILIYHHFPIHLRGAHKWNACLCIPLACAIHHLACTAKHRWWQEFAYVGWRNLVQVRSWKYSSRGFVRYKLEESLIFYPVVTLQRLLCIRKKDFRDFCNKLNSDWFEWTVLWLTFRRFSISVVYFNAQFGLLWKPFRNKLTVLFVQKGVVDYCIRFKMSGSKNNLDRSWRDLDKQEITWNSLQSY